MKGRQDVFLDPAEPPPKEGPLSWPEQAATGPNCLDRAKMPRQGWK
jgi:hypothetical protein